MRNLILCLIIFASCDKEMKQQYREKIDTRFIPGNVVKIGYCEYVVGYSYDGLTTFTHKQNCTNCKKK